jgi:carboxypeptidase T
VDRRRAVVTVLALVAALAVAPATSRSRPAVADPQPRYVLRVPAGSPAAAQRLQRDGFDVLEDRAGSDLFVLGDRATARRLRTAGFTSTVEEQLRAPRWTPPTTRLVRGAQAPAVAPVDETYYGGYHTVRAQLAHLDQVASAHSGLATVVDYGDSYAKTRDPATGYDMEAICLTRKQPGDCALTPTAPKPRFVLMAQIHAREIVTGDVAWRFVDHLANDYGTDAAVTALLDGTEVWVLPVVDPDGTDRVQQGGDQPYLQRKNLDGTGCANPPTGTDQPGVDLNRNTGDHWGASGVSTRPCDATYLGRAADSEPETRAVEGLFRKLFADQRGPADSDAAPPTTRGAMVTLHSYAGMNLFPWGWSTQHTGNDAALRRIAARMSTYNGYRYGQPGEILYDAAGTSDDWSYGELGIASFTIELASCGSFTPAHSCTATDYAANLPAIMYVAGVAKAPYA